MNPAVIITFAESESAIARCREVMCELRPQPDSVEAFVAQVLRQMKDGYRLVCAETDGKVSSVAGFRISRCLAWGKHIYVDDLVTRSSARGHGVGSALFEFLLRHAREQGCTQIHLDSGVQRYDAHRFYTHMGLGITCHHFAMKL